MAAGTLLAPARVSARENRGVLRAPHAGGELPRQQAGGVWHGAGQWYIDQLAEAEGLHRRFKATTRELSIIMLVRLLCALPSLPLSGLAIHFLYL
jgi:hypothetical protein